MTKFKGLAFLTAGVMSICCLGMTVFADTAYTSGDVDMDGTITGHDTGMVSRYLLENDYTLTEDQLALADVDGDGTVTQADADKLHYEMQICVAGSPDINTEYTDGNINYYWSLEDATIILEYYSYRAAGLDYGLTEVEKNLSDPDLDGEVTLNDARIVLALYALRGARFIEDIPSEGVYYYSEDPESPAYIGNYDYEVEINQ